jgi:hypothetical protein
MARRQFESVVAQAPKVQLKSKTITIPKSGLSGMGGTFTDVIYSSNQTFAELVGLYVDVPAVTGATSGTHSLYLELMEAGAVNIFSYHLGAEAQYNQKMWWNYNRFINGVNGADLTGAWTTPASVGYEIMRGTCFDDTNPLRVRYQNYAGVTLNNSVDGKVKIMWKETEVR